MNGHKQYKDNSVITLHVSDVSANGLVVGQPVSKGNFFGFSQLTVLAANVDDDTIFTLDRTGVFNLEVKAVAAIDIGDSIYFDPAPAAGVPNFGDQGVRLIGSAMEKLAAGATDVIMVDVPMIMLITRAEAIEDAGGPDA